MSANEAPAGASANAEKIWYHPSTEIALEVQHASRIRMIKEGKKKPFPILPAYQEDLKTDSDALLWGKLGDGMTLYFDFLKLMCWVFAATTILSIPQLVLSAMGGTYVESEGVVLSSPPVNAKLGRLTIGNLFFNDSLWVGTDELNQMRNVTIGGDLYPMTPRKVGLVLTLLDITGIIVFLVALAKFDRKIDKKADRVGKNAHNIQKYSVVVKGLPRQAKEDEIRKFFSVHGPIADVKIASYSADFLTYLQEKSHIEEELVDLLSSGFKEIQQERDNADVDGCCSKKRNPGESDGGEHIPKIAIANNTIYTRRAKHIPMLHRMGELERQLVKYANTQEDDKTDCYACFITFEKIADRDNCLKTYDDSLYARLARGNRTSEEIEKITFKCQATVEQSTKKTCSKAPTSGALAVQPRVYAAQAPTNIMWQNLEYHRGSRNARKISVGVCTTIMILVSFACIYATSVFSALVNDPGCDTQITKAPCSLFLTGFGCNSSFSKDMEPASRSLCYVSMMNSFSNSSSDSCKACWCVEALNSISDILRDELISNKQYSKACENPIALFLTRKVLLQLSVPFIVLINIILKTGLAYLVPQEKHHTRTESDRSMAHKVFISQFINTALVTLLVNTRIQNFADKFSTDGGSKFPLFTGAYDDFNLAWYIDIGGNHMVTMISNAAQTFIPLVVMWPLQIIQETWATRNTATQIILNRQLKGAEFEVAARYGVLLSTVYACMLYSANMPFLNIILFLTFLISYWVDRIFLLRVCRAPPSYDTGLVK
jgi:RNA recognition motif-containing protein